MPPKKGNAATPVKTFGVLTRSQTREPAPVSVRIKKRKASSGPEEKKQPYEWPDPPDMRRRKRARVDNAEEPAVVEEANSDEEEVPESGESVATDSDESEEVNSGVDEAAKSDEDEVAKSDEDEVAKSDEDEVAKSDEDEVAKSDEDEVAKSDEDEVVKSDEDEVVKSGEEEGLAANSGEEESLAVTSGEGHASSSKGKGKGTEQDEGQKKKKPKKRTLVIRHCKHSGDLFKARAAEVRAAFQVQGWKVRIETKIRRGSFEVREEGGAAVIQLMGMEEPYQDLVDLDVDVIVSVAVAL